MSRNMHGLVIFISFWVFMALPFSPEAAGRPSAEAEQCLTCHARHGITKVFEDNTSVAAYVNAGGFRASVHGTLDCSDCHTEFSGESHPKRRFRNSEQYKIKSALACKRCHTNERLRGKSIHAAVLDDKKESVPHTCTNCHGAHEITAVSRKTFTSEEQHCLKCHGQHFTAGLKDGDTLSLHVDLSALQASVHKKLSCSDCHFGFSHAQHPQRNFRTKRDFSIASSESCRRCHFDKYTKSMEGIHYTKLNQGNLHAPACTDCHGTHAISRFGKDRTRIAQRCGSCHPRTFDVYAQSVHGKALFDEHNQDVPVCIDCHTAHAIENPLSLDYRERIPELCSNCHANRAVMDHYGLSTNVVQTYLSDFHGITLSFYKKQRETSGQPSKLIAVCTDCHGTHNIISTRSTDPAVVKANLVKRCQVCHKDAARNFPDTWLSHYEPTLANAPLIFLFGLVYQIFTPIMAIGIILQILLHIWRYAVNR